MTTRNRFVRWLTGEPDGEANVQSPAVEQESETTTRSSRLEEPQRIENNAEAYGVTIEAAKVEPGAEYWRVVRIYHLAPHENAGRHHIFFDALSPEGRRLKTSQAMIRWEGGEHTVTMDKPENEPAANFPMWKWQICSVHMLGLPSDVVHGLRTNHPDEPNPDGSQSGNTLFHHSFLVEFQKTRAPQVTGIILGRVENSRENLTVELVRSGQVVETMPVRPDGTFVFTKVLPGPYEVHLEDQLLPITVPNNQTVPVTIVLPPRNSVIEGTVQNASGLLLRLTMDGNILAEGKLGASGTFRLRNLSAGTYFLHVVQPGTLEPVAQSDPLVMDGANQRRVELEARLPGKDQAGLEHYVLFGAAGKTTTRAQLAALAPILAERRLTFGFDRHEAALAKQVTVIGDVDSVPEFELLDLTLRGIKVQRLTGTPQEIGAALRS